MFDAFHCIPFEGRYSHTPEHHFLDLLLLNLSGFHGWLLESYCIAVAAHMPIEVPPVCAQDPPDDMIILPFVLLRTLYSVSSPGLKHCRNIGPHESLHRKGVKDPAQIGS